MGYSTLRVAVLSVILIGMSVSCRSRKKSTDVPGDSVKIIVALKNIEEVHKSKLTGLNYELACNGADYVSGVLVDETAQEVEFFSSGTKTGDTCEVRLLNLSPVADLEFLAASNVMYASPEPFRLSLRTDGQIWAEAFLKPYHRKKTGLKLTIPVVFKDNAPDDYLRVTARLKCSPEFVGEALGVANAKQADKSGEFVFETGMTAGSKFKCSSIQVFQSAGKLSFIGDLKVDLEAKGEEPIVTEKVSLVEHFVKSVSGIVIVTTPGEACQGVFDVETRTCK